MLSAGAACAAAAAAVVHRHLRNLARLCVHTRESYQRLQDERVVVTTAVQYTPVNLLRLLWMEIRGSICLLMLLCAPAHRSLLLVCAETSRPGVKSSRRRTLWITRCM